MDDDHTVHTIPNHDPTKMNVHPKTFSQIILAAKWLVSHSTTSPVQQRRHLPSLLFGSLFCGWGYCVVCLVWYSIWGDDIQYEGDNDGAGPRNIFTLSNIYTVYNIYIYSCPAATTSFLTLLFTVEEEWKRRQRQRSWLLFGGQN